MITKFLPVDFEGTLYNSESFYYVNYGSSIITSKVRQIISVKKTEKRNDITKNSSYWHFNSRFVLKTSKTPVFVFITEIIRRAF